jgi:hypothetical protein
VTERRIAGAEVVERDSNSEVLELLKYCPRGNRVIQQRRFGKLELQAMRRETGLLKRSLRSGQTPDA